MKINLLKRRTKGEVIFDRVNIIIMIIICFLTLYPIWYTLVNSFNEGMDAMSGGIYFWPRQFSIDNYTSVFSNSGIIRAMLVTISKTAIGTVVHVFFTAMVAYAFSKTELAFRKIYITMGLITLLFSGGLIPSFLLIKQLGFLDKFIVYIVPVMFSFFDALILMSFFKEIPKELEEAAKIDGASDFKIFTKIILKVSLPVIATIALFHGVYQWNDYFTGMIYINNPDLQPIQTYLYRIVAQSSSNQMMAGGIIARTTTSQSIKLATMVVTTFPIVCVYPFLQKYFVKGMMIGSVKG